MGNKEHLILVHDSDDDEDERKKNFQQTIQMLKNKDSEPALAVTEAAKQEEEVILLSSDSEGTDAANDSEEGDVAHPRRLTIRGPGMVGFASFDKYCHFANRVEMDHVQVEFLRDIAQMYRRPLYVCTMQTSQVLQQKGKMYFSKHFTDTYLKNYISTEPKNIRVYCSEGWSERVKIKMGVANQALLTTKWPSVAAHLALGQGDIVIFRFRKRSNGRLKLYVQEIYPCPVCAANP